MKLIIQIPCLNEAETLPLVFEDLPKSIEGISTIETLVIDDGSTDNTSKIAKNLGATHIIRNTKNLGLALTFRAGLDYCLKQGADIIVNMDGDNQYKGSEISKLIAPILAQEADAVVGDRQTDTIASFSPLKKFLQRFGSKIIRRLSRTNIQDATSGFRAFTREAAIQLTILSHYTYTLESILQSHTKGLAITNVPVSVNPQTRESRLMDNMRSYVAFSIATIIRVFTMYNPLRVFVYAGSAFIAVGSVLVLRFLYYYFAVGGAGKIQSLVIAAICVIVGVTVVLVGFIADIIQFNRRLLEDILVRVKRLEIGNRSGD
ncbi:glycosyltransferase family 2 protein [Oligoflexia bacterium]|nr:glycosyltransferase family 2 protein [Oligoflexia bacterium]